MNFFKIIYLNTWIDLKCYFRVTIDLKKLNKNIYIYLVYKMVDNELIFHVR